MERWVEGGGPGWGTGFARGSGIGAWEGGRREKGANGRAGEGNEREGRRDETEKGEGRREKAAMVRGTALRPMGVGKGEAELLPLSLYQCRCQAENVGSWFLVMSGGVRRADLSRSREVGDGRRRGIGIGQTETLSRESAC